MNTCPYSSKFLKSCYLLLVLVLMHFNLSCKNEMCNGEYRVHVYRYPLANLIEGIKNCKVEELELDFYGVSWDEDFTQLGELKKLKGLRVRNTGEMDEVVINPEKDSFIEFLELDNRTNNTPGKPRLEINHLRFPKLSEILISSWTPETEFYQSLNGFENLKKVSIIWTTTINLEDLLPLKNKDCEIVMQAREYENLDLVKEFKNLSVH